MFLFHSNNNDNSNFFLETNTHMRERTWGSKFDLKGIPQTPLKSHENIIAIYET